MTKNMFRHFFVGFCAMMYLFAAPLFLYQYLGLMNGWPFVFISVIYDATGAWWLDIHWHSPVIWSAILFTVLMSVAWATYKRHDEGGYRESNVQSQSGF